MSTAEVSILVFSMFVLHRLPFLDSVDRQQQLHTNLGFVFFSFYIQGGAAEHTGPAEDNALSSDGYSPSPSDDDYEHTLDCRFPLSAQDQHVNEPKEEPQETHTVKPAPAPPVSPEVTAPTGDDSEELPLPYPVPKPRFSRQTTPPTAKPRTVHLFNPSTPEKHSSMTPTNEISKAAPDSRPKQLLRKLQLTDEEKCQLGNLQSFSADSDSETPGGSSSCSSSSATAGGPSPPKPVGLDGQEEEGYWSGSTASHYQDRKHRRGIKKKELPSGKPRVRSKFSPWNLSSPRISRDTRLSVHTSHPGRGGKFSERALVVEQGCRRKTCSAGVFESDEVYCDVFSSTDSSLRHAHSASEEGADGDDDDDDDEADDEMFERDDMDLYDEKVRRGMEHFAHAVRSH